MMLLTPGPVDVHPDVLAASARPLLHHRTPEFYELSQRVWKGLQQMHLTTSMVTVHAGSGMTGIESAMASVHAPGDHVVICSHGRFGERLPVIAHRYGLDTTMVHVDWGNAFDADRVAAAITQARSQGKRIDGVWMVHAETSTGVSIDLASIAAVVRSLAPDAIIGVDTVTSLGVQELRFDAWDLDIAVTGIQKGLACPPGLAVIALSKRALARIESLPSRSYTLDLQTVVRHQRDGLFAWTPPVTLIAALDHALAMSTMYGLEMLWTEHRRRHHRILEVAQNHGLSTLGAPTAMGVVAIQHPRSNEVRTMLKDLHGLRIAGGHDHLAGSLIRIGTMGGRWNDALLERVITALHHTFDQLS